MKLAVLCARNKNLEQVPLLDTLKRLAINPETFLNGVSKISEKQKILKLTEEAFSSYSHSGLNTSFVNPDVVFNLSEFKSADLIDPLLVLLLQVAMVLQNCIVLQSEKLRMKINDFKNLALKIEDIVLLLPQLEISQELSKKIQGLLTPCWRFYVEVFKEAQNYIKVLGTQSFSQQQVFKYQQIAIVGQLIDDLGEAKDERLDLRLKLEKESQLDFSFVLNENLDSIHEMFVSLEKSLLIENDRKYRDKKDRFNLNLKDIKIELRKTVAEDVEEIRTNLAAYENNKKNDFKKQALIGEKSPQLMQINSEDVRPSKNEVDNPEFSPIISEDENENEAINNNFINARNPLSDNQNSSDFQKIDKTQKTGAQKLEILDVQDLMNPITTPKEASRPHANTKADNSTFSPPSMTFPYNASSNVSTFLGQLKPWQRFKKAIAANVAGRFAPGDNKLTAFCKKLETGHMNLKMIYSSVTDDDLDAFLRRYPKINKLVELYVNERLTYEKLIKIIANPDEPLEKLVTKKQKQVLQKRDSLLNELFDDFDKAKQKSGANKKSQKNFLESSEANQTILEPPKKSSFEISDEEKNKASHVKVYNLESDEEMLPKRIKEETAKKPKTPTTASLYKLDFPRDGRITLVDDSDERKPKEQIFRGVEFLTSENPLALRNIDMVERTPKIRTDKFRKSIEDILREHKSRDPKNPTIVCGFCRLDLDQIPSHFFEYFERKQIWGHSCSPNVNFYLAHISSIDANGFEQLNLDLNLISQSTKTFDDVFIFFMKKMRPNEKSSEPIKFQTVLEIDLSPGSETKSKQDNLKEQFLTYKEELGTLKRKFVIPYQYYIAKKHPKQSFRSSQRRAKLCQQIKCQK